MSDVKFIRKGGRIIPIRRNKKGEEIPSAKRPPAQLIMAQKDVVKQMNNSWKNTFQETKFRKWDTAYEGMRSNMIRDVFSQQNVQNIKGLRRRK